MFFVTIQSAIFAKRISKMMCQPLGFLCSFDAVVGLHDFQRPILLLRALIAVWFVLIYIQVLFIRPCSPKSMLINRIIDAFVKQGQ